MRSLSGAFFVNYIIVRSKTLKDLGCSVCFESLTPSIPAKRLRFLSAYGRGSCRLNRKITQDVVVSFLFSFLNWKLTLRVV